MWIEISIACAASAAAACKIQQIRQERRRVCRREQLLLGSLHLDEEEEEGNKTAGTLSSKRLEMELLLLELHTVGEELSKALEAEAASDAGTDGWRDARQDVDTSEERYRKAVLHYREFMHTLPPPLHATAVDRASRALAWMQEDAASQVS
jgi:hypothetical protein